MKSNEQIKKFPPGEIGLPKCAKNQSWEGGDKSWSLGGAGALVALGHFGPPGSTGACLPQLGWEYGSMQKPEQPTTRLRVRRLRRAFLLYSIVYIINFNNVVSSKQEENERKIH